MRCLLSTPDLPWILCSRSWCHSETRDEDTDPQNKLPLSKATEPGIGRGRVHTLVPGQEVWSTPPHSTQDPSFAKWWCWGRGVCLPLVLHRSQWWVRSDRYTREMGWLPDEVNSACLKTHMLSSLCLIFCHNDIVSLFKKYLFHFQLHDVSMQLPEGKEKRGRNREHPQSPLGHCSETHGKWQAWDSKPGLTDSKVTVHVSN